VLAGCWSVSSAVAVLVGLNVSFKDLGAVGESLSWHSAMRLADHHRPPASEPAGVAWCRLTGLTAVLLRAVRYRNFPGGAVVQVLLAVLTLAVVCTALGFLCSLR